VKPCPSCKRHVELDERSCPFCGEAIGETTMHRAAFAVGLAAMLGGCGPLVDDGNADGDDGSTDAPDGTTSSSTSIGTTVATSSTSFPPTTTTGDESGSGSTFGSSTTEVDSSDFIIDPDGSSVYGVECSVWDQDCGGGDKCMPWANDGGMQWNATRCSPIAPSPGQAGDPCTMEGSPFSGIDDCDIGLMCFHVDPNTLEGVCVAMCEGSENSPVCSDPSLTCTIANEGTIILCLQPCDPLAQDCPDGLSCQAGPDQFVCVRPGEGVVGDPCSLFVDCDPGLSCVPLSTAMCDGLCCTEACDPVSPMCTQPEQTCLPLGDAGVCSVE
jgi:hypothetical protein